MKTLQLLKTFGFFALFIFFYGCTEENYYTTIEGLGKVNVYIEGDITNAEAQAKLTAEIGTNTENIYVQETTQLTDITINLVGNIRDIYFDKNLELKNVTINGNNTKANGVTLSENNPYSSDTTDRKFENVTINDVVEVNFFTLFLGGDQDKNINCNDLINIKKRATINSKGNVNFNKLKYIAKNITLENYFLETGFFLYGNYSQFQMPLLEEAGRIQLYLTGSISFPSLKKAKSIDPSNISGLTAIETVDLPVLEEIHDIFINTPQTNVNLNIPSLIYCKHIRVGGGLSSDKVNAILNKFLTVLPASDKTITLWQSPAAPPTGQGLIDKQTLINQGNTVLTD
jgi:hypothetical protein